MRDWSARGFMGLRAANQIGQGLGDFLSEYLKAQMKSRDEKEVGSILNQVVGYQPMENLPGTNVPSGYNLAQPKRMDIFGQGNDAVAARVAQLDPTSFAALVKARDLQNEQMRSQAYMEMANRQSSQSSLAKVPPAPSGRWAEDDGNLYQNIYKPGLGWVKEKVGVAPKKDATVPSINPIKTRIHSLTQKNMALGQKMLEIDAWYEGEVRKRTTGLDEEAAKPVLASLEKQRDLKKFALKNQIDVNESQIERLNQQIGGWWTKDKAESSEPETGSDYSSMSEDEIFSRAWTGDKVAYAEAKRRGLVK